MKKWQTWIVKKIFEKAFSQGPQHTENIKKAYELIRTVVINEFTEENIPTINAFLLEQFSTTQKEPLD